MDGRTDGQTDRQTDRPTDRQTDIQTDIQTDRPTDRQTGGRTEGQTDRPTDRQTDRQTDQQTDRPTDNRPYDSLIMPNELTINKCSLVFILPYKTHVAYYKCIKCSTTNVVNMLLVSIGVLGYKTFISKVHENKFKRNLPLFLINRIYMTGIIVLNLR